MPVLLERRLREFVDRTDEMAAFCRMLDAPTERPVMVVWGAKGMGKSSLIARMLHECALRNAQRAEVIYTEDNIADYLAVMRKCRDDLGLEGFNELTELINYFFPENNALTLNVNITGGEKIEVGKQMNAEGANIGQMAGVVLKDFMVAQPRTDLSVTEGERRHRLTKAFINALARRNDRLLVLVVDGAEKMTDSTRTWLWEEVIAGAVDASLAHVRFVVCGEKPPNLDFCFDDLVYLAELKPLGLPDVIEYLARRGAPENERELTARALMDAAEDNTPFSILKLVDTVAKKRQWKQ